MPNKRERDEQHSSESETEPQKHQKVSPFYAVGSFPKGAENVLKDCSRILFVVSGESLAYTILCEIEMMAARIFLHGYSEMEERMETADEDTQNEIREELQEIQEIAVEVLLEKHSMFFDIFELKDDHSKICKAAEGKVKHDIFKPSPEGGEFEVVVVENDEEIDPAMKKIGSIEDWKCIFCSQ